MAGLAASGPACRDEPPPGSSSRVGGAKSRDVHQAPGVREEKWLPFARLRAGSGRPDPAIGAADNVCGSPGGELLMAGRMTAAAS
jgi:hypothetical protein